MNQPTVQPARKLMGPDPRLQELVAERTKQKEANFFPKDFAELSTFARAKLKRTKRRKTLVAAFWKQADLPF
jgi:hypothetical protein